MYERSWTPRSITRCVRSEFRYAASMRRWVLAVALVCACTTSSSDDDPNRAELEQTLRTGLFPFPPNYPGNGDLSLYEGPTAASGDCLIYDILGTQVHAGAGPN